jgi:hypothetical protein
MILEKCYQTHYSINCTNCRESYFLDGCNGCANCFGCSNLNQKQYWVYNEQKNQEEFERVRNEFLALTGEARAQKITEIRERLKQEPKKFARILDCEDSTGDHLYHGKNLKSTFYANGDENLNYCSNVDKVRIDASAECSVLCIDTDLEAIIDIISFISPKVIVHRISNFIYIRAVI